MSYNVGNKVRIKSVEWYNENKNKEGIVEMGHGIFDFVKPMAEYLGKEANITEIVDDGVYLIDLDGGDCYWADEMFEGLVSVEKPIISTEMIKDIAEVIKTHNLGVSVSENDGKLIIEPLKVEKEDEDLPIDTPCMVSPKDKKEWHLRYYSGNKQCYGEGDTSINYGYMSSWDYIIPFDKFNPKDIKESLKYNIVKNNQ